MLDDLLGRTELKEQIESLESEIHHLERQLDAEQRRRTDAVTERQEAEHRANRYEDRIEQLEDRIEQLESTDTSRTFTAEARLHGDRLAEVLTRLESFQTGVEGVLSAYVADEHDVPVEVRETVEERTPLVARSAPCLVLTDDASLVSVCLRPPVAPEPFVQWGQQFRLDREWFEPRGRYTLALVRSDLFAMGAYQGDERTAFHGFDSALKSQHSKGGFSQARFERLRDEQIESHLERCTAAIEEADTDRLYVVGEGSILGEFTDLADRTATVDATGDPEEALESAWRDFWSVQLRVL